MTGGHEHVVVRGVATTVELRGGRLAVVGAAGGRLDAPIASCRSSGITWSSPSTCLWLHLTIDLDEAAPGSPHDTVRVVVSCPPDAEPAARALHAALRRGRERREPPAPATPPAPWPPSQPWPTEPAAPSAPTRPPWQTAVATPAASPRPPWPSEPASPRPPWPTESASLRPPWPTEPASPGASPRPVWPTSAPTRPAWHESRLAPDARDRPRRPDWIGFEPLVGPDDVLPTVFPDHHEVP